MQIRKLARQAPLNCKYALAGSATHAHLNRVIVNGVIIDTLWQ